MGLFLASFLTDCHSVSKYIQQQCSIHFNILVLGTLICNQVVNIRKAAIAYGGCSHVVDGGWKCGWLDDGSASMSNEFTVLSVEIWVTV